MIVRTVTAQYSAPHTSRDPLAAALGDRRTGKYPARPTACHTALQRASYWAVSIGHDQCTWCPTNALEDFVYSETALAYDEGLKP